VIYEKPKEVLFMKHRVVLPTQQKRLT